MVSLTSLLNMSSTMRRLMAVTLLVLAVAVVVGAGFIAVESLQAKVSELEEKRVQLGRLNAVIALKPAIEASMPAESATGDRPEFLQGASEAVIRANLQTQLNKMAAAAGVTILSVGNTPIIQQGETRFAGLRANISGANKGIVGLIFAIDTARPYLTIRDAKIQSTLDSQARGPANDVELVMQIQFYGALPPEAVVSDARTGAVK